MARSAEYTIYLLNTSQFTPDQIKVHIWGTDGDLNKWDYDESMQHSGKYYNGKPVYEYNFEYPGQPTGLIFRYPDGNTPDLTYTDRALFDRGGNVIAAPGFTYQQSKKATVYFYDSSGWSINNISLVSSGCTILGQTHADTGLYYADAENHWPVYSYSIEYLENSDTAEIQFVNTSATLHTASQEIVDGAMYHFDGDYVVTDIIPDASDKITAWERSHTVYFIDCTDSNMLPGQWAVHVWDRSSTPLTQWADNETLTSTGKYTEYQGKKYKVYSYTFTWDKNPEGIIFHEASGSRQTDDLTFTDNALYGFYPKGSGQQLKIASGDFDLKDVKSQTIYFADVLGWGDNNIRAHIWGTEGDYATDFNHAPFMTATGKYVRIGDLYRPVYSLTVETLGDGRTDVVQIRRDEPLLQCANYEFIDGALYSYYPANQPYRIITDFELVDEVPVTPGTVYFHIGANQILTGLWERPRAHFHLRDAQFTLPVDDTSDFELMREVDEGLWAIDVDNTQLYDAVTFYYLRENDVTHEMEAHTFPSTEPAYFDPSTYATYIYDIGTTCVFQSYMTPAQYEAERGKDRDTIYLIGNSGAGFADDSWTLTGADPIDSEHGVFFREIVAGSQDSPTEFKLSWVNVKHYAEEAGEMYRYENQRGWATFNLGLYGYETRNIDWQVDTERDVNNNRVLVVYPNMAVGYNSFNQYGWRVSQRNTPGHDPIIEGKTYWLVIDTHDDDRSVTLLDFDPNPQVKVQAGDITPVELGYDRAVGMHGGDELKASAANGAVYFDYVNVASGIAYLRAPENETLDIADFTVVYTIYMNDVPVAMHEGKPADITVPFIPVGDNVRIAVRARYTDTQTGRSFCSRYSAGEFTTEPALARPSLTESFKTLMLKEGVSSPDNWAFDALLNLGYDVNTDLAVYADYELKAIDGYHIGHPELADGGRLTPDSRWPSLPDAGGISWTAYNHDGAYGDIHNWSKTVKSTKTLPVNLETVLEIAKSDAEYDYEVNLQLTAYGVYPFLVNIANAHAGAAMRANTGAAAPVLPDDLSGYAVIPVITSTDYATTLGNKNVTGIANVSAEAPDTEAEYYDLRGMRVDRPDVPGIYIERRGAVVRKIAVM
ncbi:MAG: hypothetical protein Q4C34_04230 [Bacteroidales bacterium]|nr:hypothetical protein [Bacteroidales bacterium]